MRGREERPPTRWEALQAEVREHGHALGNKQPSGPQAEYGLVGLYARDLSVVLEASISPVSQMKGPRMLMHDLADEINAVSEIELRRAMRFAP